ncbi:hypothetical protein Nans01_27530 [Nocardiopsis ansamitocini]|uniref:Uncharacterized protein n=1 Tax=Nocardiopsis ansamitocini TaxID=1670832 RepID=A0A9W6P7C7_9ACTN|nr:hypothetical protein Nans01_27530 [Nocardiopsis ansamitocini]
MSEPPPHRRPGVFDSVRRAPSAGTYGSPMGSRSQGYAFPKELERVSGGLGFTQWRNLLKGRRRTVSGRTYGG